MLRFLKSVILLSSLFFASYAKASAWLMKEGEGILINSFYYSYYPRFVDENGDSRYFDNLLKVEYKPYLEYGLTDNFSLGLSPSLQYLKTRDVSSSDSNYGFVYTEIISKILLYQNHNTVISNQLIFEVPGSYRVSETPTFGNQDFFVDGRLSIGQHIKPFLASDEKFYYSLQAAIKNKIDYNFFGEESGSALKVNLKLGFNYYKNHEFLLELDHTKSLSALNPSRTLNEFDYNDRYGYDLTKMQLSLVKDYGMFGIQTGYHIDLYSRATGMGQGVIISVWKKF